MEMHVQPIGIIHTPFQDAQGTPIQPRAARGARGEIEIYPPFAEALKDIEGMERIWLLYWFHRAKETKLIVTPYMDTEPHGLFATRAPCRPNPIGMSSVKLLGVEGRILQVEDVDMLDGTPLIDIKPYHPPFDCFETSHNGWLDHSKAKDTANKEWIADNRFTDQEKLKSINRRNNAEGDNKQ